VGLFNPVDHEALAPSAWDERAARAVIEQVITRAVEAFAPGRFWPRHPSDEYGSPAAQDKGLWIGAAGVLWALDRLGVGLGEADVYGAYLDDPDFPGSTGLMMGEVGVLLVSWKLAPTDAKEQRLFERVEGNMGNPSHELFNGAPGTMFAALHVYEATGAERWRELWQRCAAAVCEQFRVDPEIGVRLWIQYRRGRLVRSIGAGHGFASNVSSLLRGRDLLPQTTRRLVEQAAAATAGRLALNDGSAVNWPTAVDAYWAQQFPIRVQWCHGAPGVITGLSALPRDDRLDELLRGAGELIWAAGPLRKGPGLCHGTAGNGYAFLALHTRFGDEIWRERARAFAAHAVTQLDPAQPRHSLWTGDLGVALYLKDCLDGFTGMPTLDYL
jgi:hypothetical protein